MATKYHNLSEYNVDTVPDAGAMRFGIVVSEWNDNITGALLDGALKTLSYQYQAYSKFTVRTNTVQIVGAATTQTVNTYTFG